MKYYNLIEFAEFVHVEKTTLHKRTDLPGYAMMTAEDKGRPARLWREQDVIEYKQYLVGQLHKLLKQDVEIREAAGQLSIGIRQAELLLRDAPSVKKALINNFHLVLKTSSQLNRGL